MSDNIPRIQQFISNVKERGVARENRYIVDITPPSHPRMTEVRRNTELTSLFCHKAVLPAINIESIGYNIFNEIRQIPYRRTYGKLSLTFYMDGGLAIKRFFDQWLECVVNSNTNAMSFYASYIGLMYIRLVSVEQLNMVMNESGQVTQATDNIIYSMKLHDVYPSSIEQIGLNAQSSDEMELSVNFNYRYYEIIPTTIEDALAQRATDDPTMVVSSNPINMINFNTTRSDPSVPSSSQEASADIGEQ